MTCRFFPRSSLLCGASGALALVFVGCSAPDADPNPDDPAGQIQNPTGDGEDGEISDPFGGQPTGQVNPNDERDLEVRQEVCDDTGTCTCLRLALLGTLESAANNKDTQPFVDWLNNNSGGSAVVEMLTTQPKLTEEFLNQYDILLVANVNGWTFSAEEKAAVGTWSETTGGGIITLTGFISQDGTEPRDTSQLLEFSGLSYTSLRSAEGAQGKFPVYYGDDTTTDRSKCLSSPQNREAQTTAPIAFTPQTGSLEPLTAELDYVGAFIGYGVNAPEGATVVATDPMSQQPIAVAHEVKAKGRVFAFGDEWVVFKNQWEDPGPPDDQNEGEGNACWQPEAVDADGNSTASFFHSVQTLYQTKQFWYNAINWVAPPNECFIIEDDEVVVVVK